MSKFKLDSEGPNKTLRVDQDGCSIVSPASIDAIAKRVLELKTTEHHLADAYALCETYDNRVKRLIDERDELVAMLRCVAEDDYKKRTGFIHTITEDDIIRYVENLRLRVRREL
jgi:hypothetical protein